MSRLQSYHVCGPHTITAHDIKAFENELGFLLPDDYREFIMKYGFSSGEGDLCLKLADDSDEDGTSIDVFYGLKSGEEYDLRERRKTFSDRLPAYLLPFVAGSGGEYCLCLFGDNVGKVYWWFQEMGEVQSEDELEPIAESFDDFMNSLICEES